ncbi:hypothetical protein [Acinetobacter sp. 272263]|uniref:hypothetical protein n=1 Tax=Acinetobacter sp. 272263 TaxID=1310639 RepID=UPI00044F12EF|nr:hypothetical protein [Acinetobacter sp. 272263]EXB86820.1 hypothetical protein J538_1148 [Acinetobacter sp. 272263]
MERILKIIKDWWNGKDTYEKQNQYDAAFFISPLNKKHWTSEWAHKILDFYLKNWKYIWELVIAVLTAIFVAKFFG